MKKGILLPIFSLPNKYGLGDFGYEAYEFIDILADNNIDYWEILPIYATDRWPYSPTSYMALSEAFISLEKLKDEKLLDEEILENKNITRDEKYHIAYENFNPNEEYNNFIKDVEIIKYTQYMKNKFGEEESYYLFLQYLAHKHWLELRNYANSKGIGIIGDLPIYPNFDSSEVYNYSKYYLLNENGQMDYVSGAPADCFTDEGQKWGHPLYNVQSIKEDNYNYLVDRFMKCVKLFDITRIDHFRAYDSYFKIPVQGLPKDGFYEDGVGAKFFEILFSKTNSDKFVIEDVGDIRKETNELKEKFNFAGMTIFQSEFNPEEPSQFKLKSKHTVLYTGNHDNNTIVGWYNDLQAEEKAKLLIFLEQKGYYDEKINTSIIKYLISLHADMLIIPVQDIMGLDAQSRINIPGLVLKSNWSWQLENFNSLKENINIMN